MNKNTEKGTASMRPRIPIIKNLTKNLLKNLHALVGLGAQLQIREHVGHHRHRLKRGLIRPHDRAIDRRVKHQRAVARLLGRVARGDQGLGEEGG